MDKLTPHVYQQLKIDITVDDSAAEIGILRVLLSAHIDRARSGSLTDVGKRALLKILNELQSVEHLLKE